MSKIDEIVESLNSGQYRIDRSKRPTADYLYVSSFYQGDWDLILSVDVFFFKARLKIKDFEVGLTGKENRKLVNAMISVYDKELAVWKKKSDILKG